MKVQRYKELQNMYPERIISIDTSFPVDQVTIARQVKDRAKFRTISELIRKARAFSFEPTLEWIEKLTKFYLVKD
jgi:hypothetical protein